MNPGSSRASGGRPLAPRRHGPVEFIAAGCGKSTEIHPQCFPRSSDYTLWGWTLAGLGQLSAGKVSHSPELNLETYGAVEHGVALVSAFLDVAL